LPNQFPPLAKSDFLMADKNRSIGVVVKGLAGPITVNGSSFNAVMPALAHLSDAEVANVLTYVRNSFGNKGAAVRPAEVAAVRSAGGVASLRQ
jgi:mono/diheme cytochrome c family protein